MIFLGGAKRQKKPSAAGGGIESFCSLSAFQFKVFNHAI